MATNRGVQAALENHDLVEKLAAVEHERWAHWQRYVHEQCQRADDGSLIIPPQLARRWQAQIVTPYAELTETEKDSDREQVRRYLPLIGEAIAVWTEQQP
jgi:hypothetical protein